MPTEFPVDETIDELLRLAGVSTDRSGARRWLESALVAARGKPQSLCQHGSLAIILGSAWLWSRILIFCPAPTRTTFAV